MQGIFESSITDILQRSFCEDKEKFCLFDSLKKGNIDEVNFDDLNSLSSLTSSGKIDDG